MTTGGGRRMNLKSSWPRQLWAYAQALVLETAAGILLTLDLVALIALTSLADVGDNSINRWALLIGVIGFTIGNFQLYRRRDPLFPTGAASERLDSLDPDTRIEGIAALTELAENGRGHGGMAWRSLKNAAHRHPWEDVSVMATLSLGKLVVQRKREEDQVRNAGLSTWVSKRVTHARYRPTVAALIRLLTDLNRSGKISDRTAAAILLGQIGTARSIDGLMAAAVSPAHRSSDGSDDQVRIAAVTAILNLQDQNHAVQLLGALTENQNSRKHALQALTEAKEPGTRELVARAAAGQENARISLCELSDLPNRLSPFLESGDVRAVHLLGDQTVVEPGAEPAQEERAIQAHRALLERVQNGPESVRKASATALARNELGVLILSRLLKDWPAEVLAALASANPADVQDWRFRLRISQGFPGSVSDQDFAATITASLKADDVSKRSDAAQAIGALRIHDSITELSALATNPETPTSLAVAALAGLGKMGDRSAVSPLERVARDTKSPLLLGAARDALVALAVGSGRPERGGDSVPEARAALLNLPRHPNHGHLASHFADRNSTP